MVDSLDITQALNRLGAGDRGAFDQLLAVVYRELRALAERCMHDERPDHTLQPTALVHEAYLKLLGNEVPSFANRGHFFGVAARAMRQILVDHARHGRRLKRGGGRGERQPLEGLITETKIPGLDLVALDEALQRLSEKDERKAKVVEMRYFGGLSNEETAEALGVGERTVERDWRYAQAWLRRQIEGAPPGG